MEEPNVISEKFRQYLQETLRSEYTYMEHGDVDAIARRCESEIKSFIEEKMPQMQASHARANLMTLPAELRNRIYELVLAADEGIERPDGSHMIEIADPSEETSWDDYCEYKPAYFSTPIWCRQPSVTRVSFQLAAETLPVYLGSKTFVIYVEGNHDDMNVNGSDWWFSAMPAENHRLIKDLHVRFCVNSSTSGLAGKRMACVLRKFGLQVPGDSVTSWVAPDLRFTHRGELDDWREVADPANDEEQRAQDEVEAGFCPQIQRQQERLG